MSDVDQWYQEALAERERERDEAVDASRRVTEIALPIWEAEVAEVVKERDAAIRERDEAREVIATWSADVAHNTVERLRRLLDESTGIVEGQELDDEQRRELRRIRTEAGLP